MSHFHHIAFYYLALCTVDLHMPWDIRQKYLNKYIEYYELTHGEAP